MAKRKQYEPDWEDDSDEDERYESKFTPAIRDTIPNFPIDIDLDQLEVDAPDTIIVESAFKEVQENDLKITNLLLSAQLHALSHVRTPKGIALICKEVRETLNHRRDGLQMQTRKEPTLSGKGGVIVLNPID